MKRGKNLETNHPKNICLQYPTKVSGLKDPQTKVETSSYTHHIPLLSLLTFQVMLGLSSWKPPEDSNLMSPMGLNLAGTGCESAIPTALVSRHPRSTDPKPIQFMKQFWIDSTNRSINQSINQLKEKINIFPINLTKRENKNTKHHNRYPIDNI